MADLTGQQIGRYRILRPISLGGIATTYLAVDTLLGARQVAIKTFPIRSYEQLRIAQESRLLVELDHPNILQTFDVGIGEDIFYIINPYISEGTLREHHPIGTRVPLTTVISYVKQVADALQYLHDRYMIHRNVKPDNMFRNSNSRVLLSDFGIPTILSTEASSERMISTLKYMAPEQIQGQPRYASDQYALGIVTYEWLSGKVPFSGTRIELAVQHLQTQPTPLSTIVPEIPHEVDEVVMRALEKNPQDRYPRIQAFADALEQASRPPRILFAQQPPSSPSPSLISPYGSDPNPVPSGTQVIGPMFVQLARGRSSVLRYADERLTRFFSRRGEKKLGWQTWYENGRLKKGV
jgi:serine/threonine protein kinase